jgi:hypothetical protein
MALAMAMDLHPSPSPSPSPYAPAGSGQNGGKRRQAEYNNHVWSYDFIMDQTENGARLELLPVLDEYTRESHAIPVERSIRAEDFVELLAYLFRVQWAGADRPSSRLRWMPTAGHFRHRLRG